MKYKTHKKNVPSKARAGIIAAVIVLAVSVGTIVASQSPRSRSTAPTDNDQEITIANQKIRVDAQTGRLRKPTREEATELVKTLTKLTDRSTEGLKVVHRSDGAKMVDLEDRFQTVVVGKPNPDGTTEIRCVSSVEEAAAFLGLDPQFVRETAAKTAGKKSRKEK